MANQAVKEKNTSGKTNNLLLRNNITDHWTSNYFKGNNFPPSKFVLKKKKVICEGDYQIQNIFYSMNIFGAPMSIRHNARYSDIKAIC